MITQITTKEYFAASLIELMQIKSLKHITTKDIASNCHLSSTTFYNHFKDKYDLLSWYYSNQIGAFMDRINENYDWYYAALDSLKYIKENRTFFQNALKYANGQNSFKVSTFNINYNKALKIIMDFNPAFSEKEVNIFSLKLYFYGVMEMISSIILSKEDFEPVNIAKMLMTSMPENARESLVHVDVWQS